ncbi:hypothetical protein DdX_11728 [Ditylenchus destructor]|uniref:Uncharacterized protein n=1 Tax=Ditylenchus destructor TaxID=166010 RepID=A0AAD4MYV2_9BILA|nr:hypothetical protein DdX_11728 [Ditylenchus destructor]
MIFLSLVFAFSAVFGASALRDYDSPPIAEVTKLSILNNKLIKDESLSIAHITTLSTQEQHKAKGNKDRMVFDLLNNIRQYENSIGANGLELRELPLLPAIEASEKGPVFVVNNPFFTRNHTLNDIRRKFWPSRLFFERLDQHNLTTNGLRKISELLSTLAKRYGEGLQEKVQLVALVLSRRISDRLKNIPAGPSKQVKKKYQLNVGVAVVAPEEDGYRPLSAVVLGLKTKILKPRGPGEDYPADYVEYDYDIEYYPSPGVE